MLAAKAPTLREALDKAVEQGLPYLILDGTLISSDRCADKKTSKKGREIDKWYSGKAHEAAGNVQALAAPRGIPLWVSGVLPGSTHDLTAARELVLPEARPYLKDLPVLADSGYEGAGAGVHVPVKKPARSELDIDTKTRNALLRSLLPGRTRLRADVTALARHPARLAQPDHDRQHRQIRTRSHAIRTQDDQLKVTEKTSLQPRAPAFRDRAAHPVLGPHRHRGRDPGQAPGRAERRLRREPAALHPQAQGTQDARPGLDQQAGHRQ